MWVVMRVQQFAVEKRFAFEVELDFTPMIGYLPVYETLAEARKEFPNGPFREIRDVAETIEKSIP